LRFGRARRGVDQPLHGLQAALAGVPLGHAGQGGQHTFTATVDLRQLQDEPVAVDAELAQEPGAARLEHDGHAGEEQGFALFVECRQQLVGGIAFDPDLPLAAHRLHVLGEEAFTGSLAAASVQRRKLSDSIRPRTARVLPPAAQTGPPLVREAPQEVVRHL
jgi:hypothetical protein